MEKAEHLRQVNPACPNASNPFHRCDHYCPVPPPPAAAIPRSAPPAVGKAPPPPPSSAAGYNHQPAAASSSSSDPGPSSSSAAAAATAAVTSDESLSFVEREHEIGICSDDDGEVLPPPATRSHEKGDSSRSAGAAAVRSGGSGKTSRGLPFYVFLQNGTPSDGPKVNPRCPNASNPYHVCTSHCFEKFGDANVVDGGKSPRSLISIRTGSSSIEGGGKSKLSQNKKADPRCPNASNPFHECADYCFSQMVTKNPALDGPIAQNGFKEEKKKPNSGELRNGSREVSREGSRHGSSSSSRSAAKPIDNWKVDPRCRYASNPYHICAQYCFDELNEIEQAPGGKPGKQKSPIQ